MNKQVERRGKKEKKRRIDMQSQIEVDEEDLYTWGSRKGEQERQAKECMQKKYNRFETLKVKIIKKRKEKPGRKKKKRKGKLQRTAKAKC